MICVNVIMFADEIREHRCYLPALKDMSLSIVMIFTQWTVDISVPIIVPEIILHHICPSAEFEQEIRQVMCEARIQVMGHSITVRINIIWHLIMSLGFIYEKFESTTSFNFSLV